MGDRTPITPSPTAGGTDEQKQNEAGAGSAQEQQFRQNHHRTRPPPPPPPPLQPPNPQELTAEWTVRAQLTFARAGENVRREFSSNDPVNPVRVVYKWSSVDATATSEPAAPEPPDDVNEAETASPTLLSQKRNSSSRCSGQSTPLKQQPTRRQPESFRSTTSSTNADYGGGDSAFSGSNASKTRPTYKQQPAADGASSAAHYGTRCRSTCNITLSAVADFLPVDAAATATSAADNDNFIVTNASATSTTSATEFIPEEEPDPFVYSTTAAYTVLPEKSFDESSHAAAAFKNFGTFSKILALRDAFSQTSDTETMYFEEKARRRSSNSRSPIDQQQRRWYEQRRATADARLQPPAAQSGAAGGVARLDEGHSYMPSYTPSPTQTFKSASLPRIPPLPGQAYSPAQLLQQQHHQQQQHLQHLQQQQHHPQHQPQQSPKNSSGEPQKKPRTVHIDVYCTGSEDEDQADGEASSTSSEDDNSKRHDLESNSTPQTVLDNEQMRLRHQRVTGQAMPRRLAQQSAQSQQQHPLSQQSSSSHTDLNLGHAITKSSTAEEVSESKQLLFRKHIGDQRAAKLQNLRQKYIRQASDDALSLSYPDSSRSTVRDATWSSISSAVPSSHADLADSSWKETEEHDEITCSLGKSDSFEYENARDRLRIRQMERFWSRNGNSSGGGLSSDEQLGPVQPGTGNAPARMQTPHTVLLPISEGNSHRNSPFSTPFQRGDTLPSESEHFSETDGYNTYPGPRYGAGAGAGAVPYYQRHLQSSPATVLPSAGAPPPYLQQTSHFARNRPGFLQFFGPTTAQQQPDGHMQPAAVPVLCSPTEPQLFYPSAGLPYNLQRWKSEARENLSTNPTTSSPSERSQRSGSEAPPTTTSAVTFQSPMVARRFEMHRNSPSVSEASTIPPSGYTTEYLQKARIFGKVVATRKPGHHVGPTKNPNCSCESCQRWLAERFQPRNRAFSLGERPVLKRPI